MIGNADIVNPAIITPQFVLTAPLNANKPVGIVFNESLSRKTRENKNTLQKKKEIKTVEVNMIGILKGKISLNKNPILEHPSKYAHSSSSLSIPKKCALNNNIVRSI